MSDRVAELKFEQITYGDSTKKGIELQDFQLY